MRHLKLSTATALGFCLFAKTAFGQQYPVVVPPLRQSLDSNNVNLADGRVNFNSNTLYAGEGSSLLNFKRRLSYDDLLMHNHISTIVKQGGQNGIPPLLTVVMNGNSSIFAYNLTTPNDIIHYKSTDGSSSSIQEMEDEYLYIDKNGNQFGFTKYPVLPKSAFPQNTPVRFNYYYHADAVLLYAVYKTGEELDYHYDFPNLMTGSGESLNLRLSSVTNNKGYMIKLNYDVNVVDSNSSSSDKIKWLNVSKAIAINRTVDYCDLTAYSCSNLSRTWPSLSFTMSSNASGETVYTETDDGNRHTSVNVSSLARITRIRHNDQESLDEVFEYNSDNRVSAVSKNGAVWQYNWSVADGNITATTTSPDQSNTVVVSKITTSLPLSYTDGNNNQTLYQYNIYGQLIRETLPGGQETQYQYIFDGNVSKIINIPRPGSGLSQTETSFTYSANCALTGICSNPVSIIDNEGRTTNLDYDYKGRLISETMPAGADGIRKQTRYSYSNFTAYYKNQSGAMIAYDYPAYLLSEISTCTAASPTNPASCVGTSAEVKTTISYGPQTPGVANNLFPVSETTATGDGTLSSTVTRSYDDNGNMTSIDGPLPGIEDRIIYSYDLFHTLKGVIGPDPDGSGPKTPVATRYAYNANGQLERAETGLVADQSDAALSGLASHQSVETQYDTYGRPVRSFTSAAGTVTSVNQQNYDAVGRVKCVAVRMDPASWAAQATTDACLPQTTGSFGPDRVSMTTYDPAGNILTQKEGVGTTDVATTHLSYTNNDQVASVTDANGNITNYAYDGFGRLSTTSYADGSYEQLTYGSANNVTLRRLRDGQTVSFGYDNQGLLTSKTPPSPELAVNYTYDLMGRILTVNRSGDGVLQSYTYDGLGHLLSEQQPNGTLAYQYDSAGRRIRTTWSDGFFVSYEYLPGGALSAIRENGSGLIASYDYDALGRRASVTRGNGTVTSYGYNTAGQLASLVQDMAGTSHDVTTGFSYNPAGQIVSRTPDNDAYAWTGAYNIDRSYGVNGLNQLTSAGSTALGYDDRGNLTSSGSNGYAYTSDNLMKTAPGGIALSYDASGRLMRYETGASTRFLYDGVHLASEVSANGDVQRRYVFGPGDDEPLLWYEGAGTSDRRWLSADERGSIVAVSDGTGGTMQVNAYDEFGIPGPNNLGRFGYTGQAWLPEIGLSYYKARMYSPTLGRFLQTDPIGYGDGINWYDYVGGDPVNRTDPLGLEGCNFRNLAPDEIGVCGDKYRDPGNYYRGSQYTAADLMREFEQSLSYDRYRFKRDWLVTQQKTPSHKYTVNRRLTGPNTKCSAGQVAGAVNRNAVPGNYGNHVNGQSYDVALAGGMVPIGSITFRSNADGTVFQNVTNSDHWLKWGSVTGRISGNQSSGYSISIVGEGSNSSSLVAWGNQNFGESQFHVQAISAAQELGATCGR